MNGLETEFGEQLIVTRLDANVRENEELELSYGLRGHPAFVVLDVSGVATATFIGPQPDEILRDAVTAVFRQSD